MTQISPGIVLLFVGAVAAQLLAFGLMPRTAGFTALIPTLECALMFVVSVGLLTRLIESGLNLSILVPLVSAISPLGSIAIGMLIYGEVASAPKLAMLLGACALIGFASRMA